MSSFCFRYFLLSNTLLLQLSNSLSVNAVSAIKMQTATAKTNKNDKSQLSEVDRKTSLETSEGREDEENEVEEVSKVEQGKSESAGNSFFEIDIPEEIEIERTIDGESIPSGETNDDHDDVEEPPTSSSFSESASASHIHSSSRIHYHGTSGTSLDLSDNLSNKLFASGFLNPSENVPVSHIVWVIGVVGVICIVLAVWQRRVHEHLIKWKSAEGVEGVEGKEVAEGDESSLSDSYEEDENATVVSDDIPKRQRAERRKEETEEDEQDVVSAANNNKSDTTSGTTPGTAYILVVLFVYSITFAALLLNMKFLFVSLQFHHPLVVSVLNFVGPVMLAAAMLYRDTTPSSDSSEEQESRSADFSKAFRDPWVWTSSLLSLWSLFMINSSIAFLSSVVFGSILKAQLALQLLCLGGLAFILDMATSRGEKQESWISRKLQTWKPYMLTVVVIVMVLGGIAGAVEPDMGNRQGGGEGDKDKNSDKVGGNTGTVIGLCLIGIGCLLRGMSYAINSYILEKKGYYPEIQVSSMSVLQCAVGSVFCIGVYVISALASGDGKIPLVFGGGDGADSFFPGLHKVSVILCLLGSIILAGCFDLLVSTMIQLVSGEGAAILVYARSVPLLFGGVFIFGESLTGWQWMGILLTVEGMLLYVALRRVWEKAGMGKEGWGDLGDSEKVEAVDVAGAGEVGAVEQISAGSGETTMLLDDYKTRDIDGTKKVDKDKDFDVISGSTRDISSSGSSSSSLGSEIREEKATSNDESDKAHGDDGENRGNHQHQKSSTEKSSNKSPNKKSPDSEVSNKPAPIRRKPELLFVAFVCSVATLGSINYAIGPRSDFAAWDSGKNIIFVAGNKMNDQNIKHEGISNADILNILPEKARYSKDTEGMDSDEREKRFVKAAAVEINKELKALETATSLATSSVDPLPILSNRWGKTSRFDKIALARAWARATGTTNEDDDTVSYPALLTETELTNMILTKLEENPVGLEDNMPKLSDVGTHWVVWGTGLVVFGALGFVLAMAFW